MRPLIFRVLQSLIILFITLVVLALVQSLARAAESPVKVRFAYSQWVQGTVQESPLDPDGSYVEEGLQPVGKTEIELIFWQRLGVSQVWQKLHRTIETDGGNRLEETAMQESTNLTLYALSVEDYGFNFMFGYGMGQADYNYSINGVSQEDHKLHYDMPLTRSFGGLEVTLERVGIRFEIVRTEARKEHGGTESVLRNSARYLTFFIPFN